MLCRSTQMVLLKLGELGALCKFVMDFMNGIELSNHGLFMQSFKGSLQRDLSEYFQEIAMVEAEINNRGVSDFMTLRHLAVRMEPQQKKFKIMQNLIIKCAGSFFSFLILDSKNILSTMHSISSHGDPFIADHVHRILLEVQTRANFRFLCLFFLCSVAGSTMVN